MLKRVLVVGVLAVSMAGCASQQRMENWTQNDTWLPPVPLTRIDKNPALIYTSQAVSKGGVSSGNQMGIRAGTDAGMMSGGSLHEKVIGAVVGGAYGAVAGMFYDKAAEAKAAADLYEVRYVNAYYVTQGDIKKAAYSVPAILVRYDKNPDSHKQGSYVVLKETDQSVMGRPVYRAMELSDVTPADVNSMTFVRYLQRTVGKDSQG